MRVLARVTTRAQRFTRSTSLSVSRIFPRRHRRRSRRVASVRLDRARRETDSATRRIRNDLARSQTLVFRSPHLNRLFTGAIFAPVALVAFEAFARATAVAYENVGLLFLVSGVNRHCVL